MNRSNPEGFVNHLECAPRLISLKTFQDSRGHITVGEFSNFPFIPQRFFMQEVDSDGMERGGHAHLICKQILIPFGGTVQVRTKFCGGESNYILEDSYTGLYLPRLIWSTQLFTISHAKILVFASLPFDEADYIRDGVVYEKLIAGHNKIPKLNS
jgi:UDP-2-acetamido-3-amino-2,3-dideoxy-glucuronate N-acetyltransferase